MSAFDDQRFEQKKKAVLPFLQRMFKAALRHRGYFVMLVVLALITAVAEAGIPILWQRFIDLWVTPAVEARQAGEAVDMAAFGNFGVGFFSLYLTMVLAIGGFIVASGRLQELVIYDLRNQMFERLQYLSYGFYDRNAIGHLAIRLTSDVRKVARVVAWGFLDLLFGLFLLVVSLTAMFIYNWKLSLVVLFTIPLLLFLAIRVRGLVIGNSRKARRLYSEMAAFLTEHINGVEVNKATVQEERVSEEFEAVTERYRYSSTRAALYASMYSPIVVGTGSLAAALVIYLGGHLALAGAAGITIGVLAAFFGYARQIFEPIYQITNYVMAAQDSLSAGERIFSLIDEPLRITDREGVEEAFGEIQGDIRFRDVDFHYVADKPILQNFNLHLPAGQSVALVGATGSGKTTLSNLIARFYEPQRGHLEIDGVDYRERTLSSYRQQLGIILQTPHLFSGTLRENLCYGKLDATDAEIEQALRTIGAMQFLGRLDEPVGEEGNQLSTGEKQLISFARALLKDPRVLIMDEATSSVDTLAEQQIQNGIDRMIEGRTSILIAHRLSTIRNCDRILVISEGQVIEDGSHAELMAKKGHYFQLYQRQGAVPG